MEELEKRINEHLSKDKNGAKYTKSHNAIKLEIAWKSKEKSLACKLEYYIKTLNKHNNKIPNIFINSGVLDFKTRYSCVKNEDTQYKPNKITIKI